MQQPRYVTREELDGRVRKLVRAGGTSFASGGVVSGGGGGAVVTAYEPLLGNPAADGYLLNSTIVGARSWVSPNGLRLTPVVSVLLDYADAASYINSGEPGREYVFVVPVGATGTWAGKGGQLAIYRSAAWRYETPVDYQLVLSSIGLSYSADRRIYQYVAFSSSWVVTDLMIPESSLILADNATGDVSTDQHGFCPKLPGSAVQIFCGDGLFKAIAGAAGVIKVYSKPSANIRNTNAVAVGTHSLTDVLLKEWALNEPVKGVRVSFLVKTSTAGYIAQAQLYRNGVAIGTLREASTVAGTIYTEDFTDLWAAGDVIQLYGSIDDASKTCTVSAFNLLYDRAIAGFGPWNIASVSDYDTTAEQTAYDMTAQDPT